jgi:hypothetical protein
VAFAALTIDVNTRLAGLETGLKRVEEMTSKTSRTVAGLSSAFGALKTGLAGLGVAATVGGLTRLVGDVADLQDRFGKLAQQTGVGVASLTELDYAAQLSDVSTDELATGLTRLTSKMADVAQGSKEAKRIFDDLGVSVQNADGSLRASDEVLKDIAQRFAEFPDGPEKSAFAVEIFGRAGAKLIPLLNQGRAGLAETAEEARRLGVVFDEKASKAAETFNDNLTRLSKSWEGLKIGLFTPLVQALADTTSAFLAARAAGLGFLDSLGVDKGNIADQITFFERKLAGLNKERAAGGRDFYGRPVDTTLLDAQIAETTAKLEQLRRLQLTLSGIGEPPGLSAPGAAPRITSTNATSRRPADERDPLASLIDASVQRDFERMQAIEQQGEEFEAWLAQMLVDDEQRIGDLADRWKDVIDPTRKYLRELEQIRALVAGGALTPEQGIAAELNVQGRMQDDVIGPLSDDTKEATEDARELGLTFQSAFEDAVIGGKKFSDVLRGLGQDIQRIFLRKMVTEPLANMLVGAIGGGLSMKSHATGLDYVPYDGYPAILHRGERVLTATDARAQDRSAPAMHFAPTFNVHGEMSRSQEARLAVMMRNVAIATMADGRRRAMA